ncbi:MAG: histidine kinase [Chloroflexota bacterium]
MMNHAVCCNPPYLWELCCVLFSLLIASNIWLFVRVLRPIQQLSSQAEQVKQGNFTAIDERCGGIKEIRILRLSMASMVKHVRRSQKQSVRYADSLTEGQEAERLRIARELHDDTIQSLVAISQSIDMAKAWLTSMPQRVPKMLQLAREQSVETVNNLRRLIEDLRPPALEELGLIPALKMQVDQCTIPTKITIKGKQRRLNKSYELALFRIVQEGLTNVKHHAQASQVDLIVDYQPDNILLTIHDDGQGFTPPEYLTDLADEGHYGLMGIQERVNQIGGTLTVDSEPRRGTTLGVRIPSESSDQPQDTVRDPVCSALIQPNRAYGSITYAGQQHFFCCPVCQGAFQKEPEKYLSKLLIVNQVT